MSDMFILQKGSDLGSTDLLGAQGPMSAQWFDDYGNPQATEEFWDVDGDGLNNYAWNISTIGGRSGLPPKRGSNIPRGNRPGTTWIRKPHDEKKRSLAMWVRGSDRWGNVQADQHVAFNDNLRHIRQMFGVSDRLIEITRRVRFSDSEGLVVMSAQAECVGELEPTMSGPNMGSFTVDLVFPDPYWYAPSQSAHGVLTPDISTGVGDPLIDPVGFGGVQHYDVLIGVGGDLPARPVFSINGPVVAPYLTNVTTGENFRWQSSLSAGEVLVVDCLEQSVTVGGITRYGEVDRSANDWITLAPDALNQLRFKASAFDPAASFDVEYQETFL